jgi:hypothetical protein
MFDSFVNNVPKLTMIMVIAVITEWIATLFDEELVGRDVGEFTVLCIESGFLCLACLILLILIPSLRNQVRKGLPLVHTIDYVRFAIVTMMVVSLTLVVNVSLKYHKTSRVRIIELISTLVISGLLYFSTTTDNVGITKILMFVIMGVAALVFNIL